MMVGWLAATSARQDLGVDDVQRARPRHEAAQVLGDGAGVVGLGVVGGPADVRGQHDLGERRERVVGRQVLALEVVEAGGGDLARRQRGDERVGVVDLGPRVFR